MDLREATYTLPADGATAMMDFYALYALWWDLGSGRETYGYRIDQISSHGRSQRIDWMLEESAKEVAAGLLSDTWDAGIAEATHSVEHFVIPDVEAWKWFKQSQSRMKLGQVLLQNAHDWSADGVRARGDAAEELTSWEELGDLFEDPMWQTTGYADEAGESLGQRFGGQPWSTICYAARELQRKLDAGNLVPLLGAIDKFYDLEHNSATLGEKLEKMEVTKSDLDRRAAMKSAADFLPVVSPQVARIIKASTNELPSYDETFIPMIRAASAVALFDSTLN